jgi:hypothetical protein
MSQWWEPLGVSQATCASPAIHHCALPRTCGTFRLCEPRRTAGPSTQSNLPPTAAPRSLCEIEENDVVTGEELGMPLGQQQFCRGGVVADTVGMGKTAQVGPT